MKNKRFLLLLLIINFSLIGKAQMTTLYEFGDNTNDSIKKNFTTSIITSAISVNSISNNGFGLNVFIDQQISGFGKFQLFKILPNMALYSDLEFQIEYTLSGNTSTTDLSLFTSNVPSFSSVLNTVDNLVSSNIISLANIPYTNVSGDSIFKLEMFVQAPDSVLLSLNYIKISADISTILSVNEIEKEDYKIFSSEDNITIIPNDYSNKYRVHIYNSSGQEIYYNVMRNSSSIPLNDQHGVYIVKIISNNRVITKKVFLH